MPRGNESGQLGCLRIEKLFVKLRKPGNINVACVSAIETEPFSCPSPQSAKLIFNVTYTVV